MAPEVTRVIVEIQGEVDFLVKWVILDQKAPQDL